MSAHKDTTTGRERRVFNLTNCEVRAADGDSPAVFSGYAAVFNELSVNLGGFRERIQPGCFRNAVEEGQDVRFLINHDANLILGRTASGTLKLTEDTIGLRVECELGNQTYASDLAESMRRGDIDQMSFGFTTVADEWAEKDAETGLPIRELVRANLFDVSAVAYPAYPDTTAEVRSAIAEQTPELLERAKQAAEQLEAREAATPAEPVDEPTPETPEADAEAKPEPETPETAQPEGERAGKVLSASNKEALQSAASILSEVLAAAEAGEISDGEADDLLMTNTTGTNDGRSDETIDDLETPAPMESIVRPDMRAFREWIEERGWGYDDDWGIWTLTQMIEAASCFLLYANDPNDDDAAEDAPQIAQMKTIAVQLAELLAQIVTEAARDAGAEVEERDEPEASEEETPVSRHDKERRRLALRELELELA
jgi:uncharacterized protein